MIIILLLIDTYDDNGTRNNQPSSSQNNNDNETKSNEDDFNVYVEDIINKLALDTNLTPEAQTEEPNREITEHYNPAEQLTTESLTPIPSSNNISIIQQQHQQTPSNLRIVQNISSSDTDTPVNNNTINVSNTNFRKETCNNDTSNLKKNNENKKEKVIRDIY